jgi:hypothetical protein
MRVRTRCALLAVPALAMSLAADKSADVPAEPRYDPTTVVNIAVVVVESREVAKGNPLAGTHLTVKPDSGKSDAEPLDVYLAPSDFIKQFNLVFRAGDRIEITGSKGKLGAAPVILAREVRRSDTTLYIRDQKGDPIWKYLMPGSA